jgi:hypothetical protein
MKYLIQYPDGECKSVNNIDENNKDLADKEENV